HRITADGALACRPRALRHAAGLDATRQVRKDAGAIRQAARLLRTAWPQYLHEADRTGGLARREIDAGARLRFTARNRRRHIGAFAAYRLRPVRVGRHVRRAGLSRRAPPGAEEGPGRID